MILLNKKNNTKTLSFDEISKESGDAVASQLRFHVFNKKELSCDTKLTSWHRSIFKPIAVTKSPLTNCLNFEPIKQTNQTTDLANKKNSMGRVRTVAKNGHLHARVYFYFLCQVIGWFHWLLSLLLCLMNFFSRPFFLSRIKGIFKRAVPMWLCLYGCYYFKHLTQT